MSSPNSELVPADARVVLVCGISGSGKTTLARRLEARGMVRLSSDALLWERYGDIFPTLPPERRMQLFAALDALMAERLDALLAADSRVVVDAPLCKRCKRDALCRVCAARGIGAVTVFLDASPAVIERRLAARRGTGPDDQIVSPAQAAAFMAGFERPGADEHAIVIPQL